MKPIVIYFSQTGHTKTAGEQIASELHIDAINISDTSSVVNYDLYSDFIIGFPIHDGHIPDRMITFLNGINWNGRRIYPFCTLGGYLGNIDYELNKFCQGASIEKPLRLFFIDDQCDNFDSEISLWTNYIRKKSGLF